MSYKKWVNAEIDKAKASALSEKLNIDAFVELMMSLQPRNFCPTGAGFLRLIC